MSMGLSILLLAVSFALVLVCAELFTNGVEWLGRKMRLAEGAVGSVLAAIGTALPETSIAIVAVISGGKERDVGIGAILGEPMMLATLALALTGISVIAFARSGIRDTNMTVDHETVGRDLRTFFMVYILAIGAAFVPWRAVRILIAVVLVGAYVRHVRRAFADEGKMSHDEDTKRLHFHRAAPTPRLRIITLQAIAGLAGIVLGAELFLKGVTGIASRMGVPGLVLGLIIAPIATELPETFNSITWIRQRKDTLALGNITGAMVFQSSIAPAIGILFSPWALTHSKGAMASASLAIAAAVFAWAEMTRRKRLSAYSLLVGAVFYAMYPIYVFWLAK
jgi:cation:H+ antiporter